MKFDHIALNSSNIKSSVEWYSRNMGCEVEYADETWAMLNCNGTKIALVTKGSHPPHVAFRMSSSIQIPCDEDKIRVHRDGSSYYYGSDPDGNIIEWLVYPEKE